ncbi:TetR/AcrR family transcriptional regulator [Paeniglutamicibacter cryotolerans]|uniref:AcrR family transcriptional regulator n=1 Tax=Paeniglutamicibacter cryotolerans TaxID=670079 RepID=A0A839QPQ6_9MICC|nr:helix-turn-helix domain-containing protein [Paeniglutamicibacter cryotolerans]MBB2996744.1 AcrR family transcriptional regulator [Paeniglutamicibacter cryotolerans]
MGRHSDQARQTLLDSAEELFAKYGIDAVSNRRITEHAGTANHSAIAYHFGSRDELLRALVGRHLEEMNRRRESLVAGLADDAGLRDVLACRILPWIEILAASTQPSWRARFIFQARMNPSVTAAIADSVISSGDFETLTTRLQETLAHIPPRILEARTGILGHMLLGICSEYESRLFDGLEEPNWMSVGYFLIDAGAGMLSAPVSDYGDFPPPPAMPLLV